MADSANGADRANTRKELARRKATRNAGGDVLCLHDGDYRFLNGDRSATLGALETGCRVWRDSGLEFVTIDERGE